MSFFSEAKYKFEIVTEGDSIAAENFLLTVNEILPFIDVVGPIVFKLPKADISGNVQRVLRRCRSDPEKFKTLQNIVDAEIEQGCSRERRSCTMSILWLNRTIEFIYNFMECFLSGENDMVTCGNVAYEKSFKRYHNIVIRGIFQMLIRMIPSKEQLAADLKKDPNLSDQELVEHIKEAMARAKTNIDEINRFYSTRGQHSEQKSSTIQFS